MRFLRENSKMKRSGGRVNNFPLPAHKALDGTLICRQAKDCVPWCYANQGTYAWANVKDSHNDVYLWTQTDDFVPIMVDEISRKLKGFDDWFYVRVHDGGDFYSREYLKKWLMIMRFFNQEPVKFYCYTKEVRLLKSMRPELPANFRYVFSFGGRQDALIDVGKDPHSVVFKDKESLLAAGYTDCSHDDLKIFGTRKVGLVYHGVKGVRDDWNLA